MYNFPAHGAAKGARHKPIIKIISAPETKAKLDFKGKGIFFFNQ